MKYLALSLILTILFMGTSPAQKKSPKKSSKDKENEYAVAVLKEKKDEQQLLESNNNLKDCKDKSKSSPEELEKCVNNVFKDISDEEIEKLGEKIELKSYNVEAGKNANTIREYLSKRLENAIRGDGKKDVKEISLKEMKFVDHALYSKLYRSQVGKNILLETTNYCISNFGIKDKPNLLVSHCSLGKGAKACSLGKISIQNSSSLSAGKAIGFKALVSINDEAPFFTLKDVEQYSSLLSTEVITNDISAKFWSTKAAEFEVCDPIDKDGTNCKEKFTGSKDSFNLKENVRTSAHIEAFKKAEFLFGAEYLKKKVGFCTQTVVKRMCQVYRCKNKYNKKSTNEEIIKACKKDVDIDVKASSVDFESIKDKADEKTGIVACGIMDRLKEYRRVIAALDKIDELGKESVSESGFEIKNVFKGGRYTGTGKDKSIEEITTIASSDFNDIQLNEDVDFEKLEKDCFEGDQFKKDTDECQSLIGKQIDTETKARIDAEMIAEREAYRKRIDILKSKGEGGKEELKEFLRKHGLNKIAEGDSLSVDQMADLIKTEYDSQRDALKANLARKYRDLKKDDGNKNNNSNLGNIAKENLTNLKNEKKKIQTLIQYSNILTSYLGASIENGDGKNETTLSYQRQIEFQAAEASNKTDEEKFIIDNQQNFEDGDVQSAADANLQVDVDFIDTLLGNNEKADMLIKKKEGK